jgi:uncharacterized protein
MVKQTFKIAAASLIGFGIIAWIVFFLRFNMVASTQKPSTTSITVGEQLITVEVADTRKLQTQGLSSRDSLAEDRGMLFTYPGKRIRNFWMKDIRINLDVLWIADQKVVGMQENVQYQSKDGEVARFKSNEPVNMVLEVNSGWIKQHNIKIGDTVFGLDKLQ